MCPRGTSSILFYTFPRAKSFRQRRNFLITVLNWLSHSLPRNKYPSRAPGLNYPSLGFLTCCQLRMMGYLYLKYKAARSPLASALWSLTQAFHAPSVPSSWQDGLGTEINLALTWANIQVCTVRLVIH